jgi:hypothetical protein
MGAGTATPSVRPNPTLIPGMQKSNYLSQVRPPLRAATPQLAPSDAYLNDIKINPAQPSGGQVPQPDSPDPLYGSDGNLPYGKSYLYDDQRFNYNF